MWASLVLASVVPFASKAGVITYRHTCRWCGGAHLGCECRQASRPEQGPGPIRHEHPRSGGRPLPIRNLVASTESVRGTELSIVIGV